MIREIPPIIAYIIAALSMFVGQVFVQVICSLIGGWAELAFIHIVAMCTAEVS